MKKDEKPKNGKKNQKPKVPKNGTENKKNGKKESGTVEHFLQVFTPPKQGEETEDFWSEAQSNFLWAYEYSCGNVTYSCQYAGIGRTTFYRWMDSDAPHLIEFQEAINEIKPEERLLDVAEGVVLAHLNAGSLRAAEIIINSAKGRKRGYSDKANKSEQELITRACMRIENIVLQQKKKNPDFEPDVKRFCELAASDFGVDAVEVENLYRRRESAFTKGFI